MINLSTLTAGLYTSLQDEHRDREITSWHASSIADCPRAQFYGRYNVPPQSLPTGAKILRWRAGHLIEEVIRPELQKQFPNLLSNQKLHSEKLNLTGEFDNYDPDNKALIEIKSVSSHAVKYRKVGDERFHLRDQRPYLHHEYQQAAYVMLLAEQKLPVEQIVYLYITLDGLLVPYSTPVNNEVVFHTAKRLELLNDAWRAQELPGCICTDEEHPLYRPVLQYCNYKHGNQCCSENIWETLQARSPTHV